MALRLQRSRRNPDTKWGESFEICAFDDDAEARANPSAVILADGSKLSLSELLATAGPAILGEEFATASRNQIPLLPKTLDVGELLSIQAHPEGSTEAYIIVEADEGATIRLGFRQDVDPHDLGKRLSKGWSCSKNCWARCRRTSISTRCKPF